MACMNMYGSEHQSNHIGPRISFSSDFVVDSPGQSTVKREETSTDHKHDGTPATDFEFSATDDGCLTVAAAADELFFKGKLLPLKENCRSVKEVEDGHHAAPASTKMPMAVRWKKGFLGMRAVKAHQRSAAKEEEEAHDGAELDPNAPDRERKRD